MDSALQIVILSPFASTAFLFYKSSSWSTQFFLGVAAVFLFTEKLFLRFVSSCNSGCDVRISAARPLPACDRHGCCIPRRSKWQAQITPTASATTPPRGRRRRKHTVYTSLSEPQKWLHKSPKVVVPESAESSFGRIYVPGVMNRRFSYWM